MREKEFFQSGISKTFILCWTLTTGSLGRLWQQSSPDQKFMLRLGASWLFQSLQLSPLTIWAVWLTSDPMQLPALQLYRFRPTKQGGPRSLIYMTRGCFCIFYIADMFCNRYLRPIDCQVKQNTCKHIHAPTYITSTHKAQATSFFPPLTRWIPNPINYYYYTFPKEEIQNAVSSRDFKR